MGKISVRFFSALLWSAAFVVAAPAIAGEYVLIPRWTTESSNYRFYAENLLTQERKLFRVFCGEVSKSLYFDFEADPKLKGSRSTMTVDDCNDPSAYFLTPLEFPKGEFGTEFVTITTVSPGNDFDLFDRKTIATVNELFTEAGAEAEGLATRSLQHGRKTKKVIVFMHGLAMHSRYYEEVAKYAFTAGHNVIIGQLPGHGYKAFVEANAKGGVWLQYAEWLALIAKQYGDEVVYVGHSLGGQLGVRLAENGLVNKLILSQPLIGVTNVNATAIAMADLGFTRKVLSMTETFGIKPPTPKGFLMAATHALALSKMPYKKIPARIKIVTFLSQVDIVVDNDKTKAWVKEFAPQSELRDTTTTKRIYNHMLIPEDLEDDY